MEKQAWQAPVLETLDISATEFGFGLSKVDYAYDEDNKPIDADIYDS